MAQIELNATSFSEKLAKFQATDDSYLFVLGTVQEENQAQPQTSLLHLYLLQFEFSETALLLHDKKAYFVTSKRKQVLLKNMNLDSVQVILRQAGGAENDFEALQKEVPKLKNLKMFQDESPSGQWAQKFTELARKSYSIKDCQQAFAEIQTIKTANEISALRTSAKWTEYCMKLLVEHVEHLIDQDDMRPIGKISEKIEQLLDCDLAGFKSKLQAHQQVDTQLLEFAFAPSIQANAHYNTQIGAQGQGKLTADTVLLSIGGKYQDMCSIVTRTLLIGPTEIQKKAYNFICEVFEFIQKELRVDRKLGDVYSSVHKKFADNEFVKLLPKNFGYGIGMTTKEESLAIKKDNPKTIEKGMCFNLRLSLTDFNTGKNVTAAQNFVMISDTMLVLEHGAEILTRGISRAYHDISYFLDDEEPGEDEPTASGKDKSPNKKSFEPKPQPKSIILEGRTREVNNKQKSKDFQSREQQRLQHQEELFRSKLDELRLRWDGDKVKLGNELGLRTVDLTAVTAYKDSSKMKGLDQKLFFDKQASVLICPLTFGEKSWLVPFHLRMIKNCSMSNEKSVHSLRVNFHSPNQATKDVVLPSGIEDLTFIKELTFKSKGDDGRNLNQVCTEIREALRILKQQDSQTHKSADAKEEDTHLASEQLTLIKGQPLTLRDLTIRPPISGKKTVGELQVHCNGFRFLSSKGQKIDFTYSNINHAFFQPCEEKDVIVLVHFRLKAPIMIGQKKFLDVQMYTEVCNQFEDINDRSAKRRMTEADEVQEEKRELEMRKRLDDKFQKWCNQAEQVASKFGSDLEFDMPFSDLMFSGCHTKSCVNMYPTKTSLVALAESPFFVTSMKDIELVHFERVSLAVKNFDFVLVYKDYANFKRICSVPMECLNVIKDWLDESDICFTEGPISLNWTQILNQIRSDIGGFIEQGGWSFLQTNGQDSDESESVNSDSNYDSADEEAKSDDESSDYSGSDDDSDASAAESSDVATGSEDTEGMDWDEMEKQTIAKENQQRMANLKMAQQARKEQPKKAQVKSLNKPQRKPPASIGGSSFRRQ